MKKSVLIAGLLGFLIAIAFEFIGLYRYHHGLSVKDVPGVLSAIGICLWPTGIILVDAEENLAGFVGFLISAIANGLLYAAVVWGIRSLWDAFRYEE